MALVEVHRKVLVEARTRVLVVLEEVHMTVLEARMTV